MQIDAGARVMKIETMPVDTFMQKLYCDCGIEYTLTKSVWTSDPPKFDYICEKCGSSQSLPDKYPNFVYRFKTAQEQE